MAKEDIAFNKQIVVAKRYSRALEALAQNDEELNGIYENLTSVEATIESCSDFKTFIEHPSFSKEVKKEVLGEVFGGRISCDVLHFLFILLDRNRLFALGAIINSLKDIMNKKYNILVIRAISAIELTDEVKSKLQKKLEMIYQKQIQLDARVDDGLIAGMVLKIGDKTIDGSVKARLESMKRTLIQR